MDSTSLNICKIIEHGNYNPVQPIQRPQQEGEQIQSQNQVANPRDQWTDG